MGASRDHRRGCPRGAVRRRVAIVPADGLTVDAELDPYLPI